MTEFDPFTPEQEAINLQTAIEALTLTEEGFADLPEEDQQRRAAAFVEARRKEFAERPELGALFATIH